MSEADDTGLKPDHIGWPLWQAAFLWKEAFITAMQAAGHEWYGRAQSNITAFLGPEGTRQRDLVERSGLTKQAVQQLVDDLEAAGVVVRSPDPADRRAKVIHYTAKGKAALRDGARIKRQIEARMAEGLGADGMAQLRLLLERVIDRGFDRDAT